MKNSVINALVALALTAPLVTSAEQPRPVVSSAAPAAALDVAFHEAVLRCFHSYRYDDSAMRELLRQGADVNAVDASGNNVLMQIIKRCTEITIEAGAPAVKAYVKINHNPSGVLTINEKIDKYREKE